MVKVKCKVKYPGSSKVITQRPPAIEVYAGTSFLVSLHIMQQTLILFRTTCFYLSAIEYGNELKIIGSALLLTKKSLSQKSSEN